MTSTDAASIAARLARWEIAEYFSCGLVALGCIGEYVAEFTNWVTGGDKARKERLGRMSTLLLIFALAAELICLVRTNQKSGELVGSLRQQATEAEVSARSAVETSHRANDKASKAEDASSKAMAESGRATNESSSALGLARSARTEADSFEKDIVSANTQAASAESHLAEALKRSAEARAELNRIKTPRSLLHSEQFVEKLRQFKGVEYTFVSVAQEDEAIRFLKEIDGDLQSAGWTRTASPHGFPSISPYGKEREQELQVPVGLNTGLQISVDATESIEVLSARADFLLPDHVKAAKALIQLVDADLDPPQENPEWSMVHVRRGPTTAIRIAVGKKP
jgi:hypothetical protein